ncbi:hypothetical protein [Azospirillum argentinense]|uniref:Tail terminator n=1 Tax=Azospirillum argentinense TaxID=2970906 RepID=A0A5B0KM38_9PROT|nr:hypothetical protein [Azospirillum argentinense]KAA1052951.1 hypothetical protein FH063_003358 [Azospirillum argentinense]
MTSYADAHTAILGHLKANWKATPVYDGPEPREAPEPPEPFVRVLLRGQTGKPTSVNGGHDRRHILFQATAYIVLFTPVGTGDALSIAYASDLERLFSLASIPDLKGGKVDCEVAQIGEPVPADEVQRWRSTTIKIPVRYFDRSVNG